MNVATDDLATQGVIVGMTGSRKTGLSVGLIEECLNAGVPTLLIDSKGGTWMIGRLTTENGKARLLEGRSSAAGGVDTRVISNQISRRPTGLRDCAQGGSRGASVERSRDGLLSRCLQHEYNHPRAKGIPSGTKAALDLATWLSP